MFASLKKQKEVCKMFASLKKMVKVSSRILVVLLLSLGVFAQIGLAEKITLRFQSWRLAETIAYRIFEELRLDFEKQNPEIQIKFESVSWDEKNAKLRTQIVGGNPPDVASLGEGDISLFASQDLLTNLDPFYEQEGGSDFTEGLVQGALGFGLYRGSYYSVPGEANSIELLFYNKRMFRDSGLPDRVPLTWDEFLEFAKKGTRDIDQDGVPDRWGSLIWGKSPGDTAKFFFGWFLRNGVNMLNEEGTKSLLGTPEGVETIRFYTELWTKHEVTPDPLGMGFASIATLFAQEIGAMVQHGAWNEANTLETNPDMEGQIGFGPSPIGPSGSANLVQILGVQMVIPKGAKNPEASWKWIMHRLEDKGQIEFAFQNHFVPVVLRVLESAEIRNDPIMSVAADVALNGIVNRLALLPEYPKMERVVWEELQSAWLELKSPEKALSDMVAEIDKLIGS